MFLRFCFAALLKGDPLATLHYNFNPDLTFPLRCQGSSLVAGSVSVRRSTKGYSQSGGRTGFGAPHVKPKVRPSTFGWDPIRGCNPYSFPNRRDKGLQSAPLYLKDFWPYLRQLPRTGNRVR